MTMAMTIMEPASQMVITMTMVMTMTMAMENRRPIMMMIIFILVYLVKVLGPPTKQRDKPCSQRGCGCGCGGAPSLKVTTLVHQ